MASEIPEQREFSRAESSHKTLGSVPNVIKKNLHGNGIVIGQQTPTSSILSKFFSGALTKKS
jgi:hypothetical protein